MYFRFHFIIFFATTNQRLYFTDQYDYIGIQGFLHLSHYCIIQEKIVLRYLRILKNN